MGKMARAILSTWICTIGTQFVGAQTVYDYQEKEPTEAPHCSACTGGLDGMLTPCEDWQTVSGTTGAGGTGDVDAVYQFATTAGVVYVFSFCEEGGAASFDSGLSVWDQSCVGSPFVCDDDTCGLQSRVQWMALSTATFTVRVGGFGGATGDFVLAYQAVGLSCGGIEVNPGNDFVSTGVVGGPFSPPSETYILTNKDAFPIDFEVSKTQEWIRLDDGSGPSDEPLSGILQPEQSVAVEVLIDGNELPVGVFGDSVSFDNLTDGNGSTARTVALKVVDPISPSLVVNGDFETGDLVGWTVANAGSGDFLINAGTLNPPGPETPLPPCRGSFSALVAQSSSGSHTLYQDISLLPGFDIVTLEWVDQIRNHAGAFQDPNQEFRVEVRDPNDVVLREVFSTEPGDVLLDDCVSRTVDISEFEGQTIRLAFTEEDNLFFFNLQLDDITLTLEKTNQPPLADAGANQTRECNGLAGGDVTLDGSGSSDPDSSMGTNDDLVLFEWFEDFGLGTQVSIGLGEILTTNLSLGSHLLTLRVTDAAGETDIDETTVTIVDTVPPTISVATFPTILWPPNHRMLPVTVNIVTDDLCSSPVVELASVTSDEADNANGTGDGNTVNDIQNADVGTFDTGFDLRAERNGGGDGRVYTISYSSTDGSGNSTMESAYVLAPHNQQGVTDPIVITVTQTAPGTLLEWNDVEGALLYNVIRGDVGSIVESQTEIHLGDVVCIRSESLESDTVGWEDPALPATGQAFFYLTEYFDGRNSSYGSVDATKPRIPDSGGCE